MSPPPQYLQKNDRPICDYETVEAIIKCMESYKALADVNDSDKDNIKKWLKDNS